MIVILDAKRLVKHVWIVMHVISVIQDVKQLVRRVNNVPPVMSVMFVKDLVKHA